MNTVESDTSSQSSLRATLKPIALRCDACGEENLILPGCMNTTWVCSHCRATVQQTELFGPRQKRPIIIEKARPSVAFEQLEDELARLAMEQGVHRRKGDPRLPRLFELSGPFTRIPGDPRVPKVVRGYGTVFTVLGAMGVIWNVYAFLGSGATYLLNLPGARFPLAALSGLGLATLFILAGNALRRGRRVAVYGAALATVGALAYCAWLFPSHLSFLCGGVVVAPAFVSAARHWGRFR